MINENIKIYRDPNVDELILIYMYIIRKKLWRKKWQFLTSMVKPSKYMEDLIYVFLVKESDVKNKKYQKW